MPLILATGKVLHGIRCPWCMTHLLRAKIFVGEIQCPKCRLVVQVEVKSIDIVIQRRISPN